MKKIYSAECNIVFRQSNEHGYSDSSHSKGDKPVYKEFGKKAKEQGTCAFSNCSEYNWNNKIKNKGFEGLYATYP